MKKQLSFLLAALMLTTALASCGGDDAATADTNADTASATETITETEPVVTEPVTTEPVETEPPMVEVFTPVYEEFFEGEKVQVEGLSGTKVIVSKINNEKIIRL